MDPHRPTTRRSARAWRPVPLARSLFGDFGTAHRALGYSIRRLSEECVAISDPAIAEGSVTQASFLLTALCDLLAIYDSYRYRYGPDLAWRGSFLTHKLPPQRPAQVKGWTRGSAVVHPARLDAPRSPLVSFRPRRF